MLASIASWLTPAGLFLVLNLTIGTIVITTCLASSRKPNNHQQQPHNEDDRRYNNHHQIGRAPSLIDRVKSIDFSQYKFPSFNVDNFDHHDPNPQPPLARAPSFLNRVRSINFSHYKFQSTNYETEFAEPEHSNRVDSSPTTLTRAPSLLDRVKSNLSALHWSSSIASNRSISDTESDSDEDADLDHHYDEDYEIHVTRSKSEKQTRGERMLPEKMKKSASEKNVFMSRSTEEEEEIEVERRRPQTVKIEKTASFGGDVDAKADDFINKFKQQLKLQRVDSLLRYKEMMTRKGK